MAVLFTDPHLRRARIGPFSKPRTTKSRIGAYSRPHSLTNLDGRCTVSRCIRDLAQALCDHVGGDPTPSQMILIREAAIKNAKLGMLVDRVLQGEELDVDLSTRCYLAWSNSLRRDLEALGLERPEVQAPTVAGFLSKRSGSGGREAA